MYVKMGQFDQARLWYGNAQASPTYATWRYRDIVAQRLASDFKTLQAKFVADSGKLDVTDPALSFQSTMGCANCHALGPNRPTIGLDTGPGNTLLDLWIRRCRGAAYDDNGQYAASGRVSDALLAKLLEDPYFAAPAPKSTGRELFNMAWLERQLAGVPPVAAADVQATLAELTAATIVAAVHATLRDCRTLIVCGGGAHNAYLMARLRGRTRATVETTAAYGLSPDWVEGAAFAWLARARLRASPGNLPSVTGARRSAVLGGVYWGPAP
jgi:anhydro-N-acetylmuramic acid kinase